MTGGSTRQSFMRLPNCLTSRSEGRGQGRPKPARAAPGSLRARRNEGYSCNRLGLIQLATRVRVDRGNSRLAPPAGFEPTAPGLGILCQPLRASHTTCDHLQNGLFLKDSTGLRLRPFTKRSLTLLALLSTWRLHGQYYQGSCRGTSNPSARPDLHPR
jgi:hypothetical protein